MKAPVSSPWAREAAAARRAFELLRQAWGPERPAWLVSTAPFRPRVRIEVAADAVPDGAAPLELSSWTAASLEEPGVGAAAALPAVGSQASEIGPWYDASADTVFARFDWRSPEEQSSPSRSPRPQSAARAVASEQTADSVAGTDSAAAPPVAPASSSESGGPSRQNDRQENDRQAGSLPASEADSSAGFSAGGGALADAFADFDWK